MNICCCKEGIKLKKKRELMLSYKHLQGVWKNVFAQAAMQENLCKIDGKINVVAEKNWMYSKNVKKSTMCQKTFL